MITTFVGWLNSFKQNKNTGVDEEKRVGIEILLKSGLDNSNNLPNEYNNIKSLPQINGIIGLINVTQSDNIGGTGDIGIVYNDGLIEYYSITQWKGKISKCICNPSACKQYKLFKNAEIEEKNNEAYILAKDYRREQYGDIPNKKWKRVSKCPGTKMMCEYLAKEACKSWNENMSKEEKINSINNFLDLNKKLEPQAAGIIYWNKRKNRIEHIYKWELKINIEDYLDTYSDGIYIYHGKPNDFILKTQAKYNNGIIEGMSSKISHEQWIIKKSSNYLTSWNVVAVDLTKIFKMTTITLDK